MGYLTITTWEITDGEAWDLALRRIREKRLPALKEMGALSVKVIRTSDRTIAGISEWPDRESRDAAETSIAAVRAKLTAEDHSRLTGEMRGEIVAEV
ncbi:MAG: hypothetical protein HKN63_11790 [Rhodobacteraceae bacterium]|nr:hypothetical protein [Paracoccaceae bacterium]